MTQSKIDVSFPEARIILLRTEKEPNTVYLQIEKERANIRVALTPASVSVIGHKERRALEKQVLAEELMASLGADPEAPPADSRAGGAIGAWKEAQVGYMLAKTEHLSASTLYDALIGLLPLQAEVAAPAAEEPAGEESEPEAAPEPVKPAKRKKG